MKRITVEEKHMIRKAQRQAKEIRRMMLIDGIYKFKMTPNVTVKPYAFCNHNFTKGDDTE